MRLKALFLIIFVAVLLIAAYIILGRAGIIPIYICGSTMGINGPVNWCQWHKGTGILVG